jgi:hypothetical protein
VAQAGAQYIRCPAFPSQQLTEWQAKGAERKTRTKSVTHSALIDSNGRSNELYVGGFVASLQHKYSSQHKQQ